MAGFQMKRLGMMMEPEPGNPLEVEGVLNPAGVRGPDGQFLPLPAPGREGKLLAHRHRTSEVQ